MMCQLRGSLAEPDQDDKLGPDGMRGADDYGDEANPYAISSDDGSSSDDGDLDVPLDEAAQAVLKAWLSRTRAQLGLPAKGITRPDISSDDDTSDDSEDGPMPPANLPPATAEIARKWLEHIRGQLASQGGGQGQRQDISSDESSEEDRDRPSRAPSQRTIEIAKKWLARVRPAAPGHVPPADISDDDSSSGDESLFNDAMPVSATSAR